MTTGEPAGPDALGGRLIELVQVMDTLRVNCPWDRRQTHESLAPHLLEETYEALDALTGGDPAALREELGDVLLQVVFHARIAQERTDGTGYTIDDVAAGITDKLKRRHPHVFGHVAVTGPDEVKRNWDSIKAAERAAKAGGGPVSALDGVPMSQPALSLAAQLCAGRTAPGHRRSSWTRSRPRRMIRAPPRRPGRRPSWGRNCSRWWRGRRRPAWTRNWSCARPRASTRTGSAPGKRRRPDSIARCSVRLCVYSVAIAPL